MEKQSESRGNTNWEKDRENTQSGGNTQMKGGQSQQGQGESGSTKKEKDKGRTDDMRDQSRGSGTLGAEQHTEAGSTGTSGGQVSPQPGMRERTGGSSSGRKD